jgi:hypothetical protein
MPATPRKNDFLNLDELEAEATGAPFFIRLGGKKIELPNASTMTVEQGDRFDTGDRRAVMVELIGEEQTAALWRIRMSTLNRFLSAWLQHSGTDLGEDEASAVS